MNASALSPNPAPDPNGFILPGDELIAFVKSCFEQGKDYLGLMERYGSPLWVLESEVLKNRAQDFSRTFSRYLDPTGFYFAMKSNNHPEVSATLLTAGFGLDVSSGAELETALALDAQDIVFSGPGKTDAELSLALDHRERVVLLMDSLGEMDRLNALIGRSVNHAPMRVGIRLTSNPNGLWRKFGILPERLPEFWNRIRSLSRIRFCGLQFHSSWNLTPDRQTDFILHLGQMLSTMPEDFLQCIDFIDVGGGYWPEQGEWLHCPDLEGAAVSGPDPSASAREVPLHFRMPATTLDEFAQALSAAVRAHLFPAVRCRICFEPGRWICHSAMHLLMTVVDRKAPDLVVTDAGTNAVGWERFETDYFPVLNLTRPDLSEKPCHVLGSLCTPHDVWGYAYFGKDIQVGDRLMIPCQGAYTWSLGQDFIKKRPGFVKI